MVFALELCEPSDMQNAFRLVSETFGHVQSYIDAVFPAHWTPIGRKQGGERLLHDLTSDPTVRFLKATDTETGNLAGLSKWYIYEKDPIEDELEGDYWESDDSKAYAMHLYKEYYSNRRRVIRSSEKPILSAYTS